MHKSFKQVSGKFKTDSYQFSPKSLQQCLPWHGKTRGEEENNLKK